MQEHKSSQKMNKNDKWSSHMAVAESSAISRQTVFNFESFCNRQLFRDPTRDR